MVGVRVGVDDERDREPVRVDVAGHRLRRPPRGARVLRVAIADRIDHHTRLSVVNDVRHHERL